MTPEQRAREFVKGGRGIGVSPDAYQIIVGLIPEIERLKADYDKLDDNYTVLLDERNTLRAHNERLIIERDNWKGTTVAVTEEVERLKERVVKRNVAVMALEAEIERLKADHDDYVVRANENVCALNQEIERLREQIVTEFVFRPRRPEAQADELNVAEPKLMANILERMTGAANDLTTLSESYEGQRQCGWFLEFAAIMRDGCAEIERLDKQVLVDGEEIEHLRTKVERFKADHAGLKEQDFHYLRSILGQLCEVRAFINRHVGGSNIALGDMVLADNIDWLDCFIDKQGRSAKSKARINIESKLFDDAVEQLKKEQRIKADLNVYSPENNVKIDYLTKHGIGYVVLYHMGDAARIALYDADAKACHWDLVVGQPT
jgi:uncharacterized small protein (DUF1192 family)